MAKKMYPQREEPHNAHSGTTKRQLQTIFVRRPQSWVPVISVSLEPNTLTERNSRRRRVYFPSCLGTGRETAWISWGSCIHLASPREALGDTKLLLIFLYSFELVSSSLLPPPWLCHCPFTATARPCGLSHTLRAVS